MHHIVIKLLPFLVTVLFEIILDCGVYSKPSERSKMELFVKIIDGFQLYSNYENFHYMKKCLDMNLSPYLLILKGFFRGIFAKRLEVQKLVLKVLPCGKHSKERPYSRFCSCLALTFFLKMANLQRSIAFLN